MYNLRPNQRRAEADAREPSDSESSHKSCSSRSSRRPGSKRATSIMSSISARSQEIIEEQSKEIQRLRAENEKIKTAELRKMLHHPTSKYATRGDLLIDCLCV